MRQDEEFFGEQPEGELFFDEISDTDPVPIQLSQNPEIILLKGWFKERDIQSLSTSNIKLEPEQWKTLCHEVLWFTTVESVLLLPTFSASSTLQIYIPHYLDSKEQGELVAHIVSPIEFIFYAVSQCAFLDYDNQTFLGKIACIFPCLLEQSISQNIINTTFSTLCNTCPEHEDEEEITFYLIQLFLASGKVSPAIIQHPLHQSSIMSAYKDEYLPLDAATGYFPLEYKETLLERAMSEISEHNYPEDALLLESRKKLTQEKTLYKNTLVKFWLFSEATNDVLIQDVKPAIAKNMHAVFEVECRELPAIFRK